jgi:CelD/BcsL family acetyltransferase involved in cellulose biosynthesis
MLAVSAQSWKQRAGTHIGGIPHGAEFYRALCDEFGPTGEVDLWQLLKDGTPIAFEFGIRYQGVTYPLRADYRVDYAHLSPGGVLECHIIKALFDDPVQNLEYNSCANRYPYLLRWTGLTRPHVTMMVFPNRMFSRALHALEFGLVPAARFVRNRTQLIFNRKPPILDAGKEEEQP